MYIPSSVSKIMSVLSVIFHTIYGAVCIELTLFSLWWLWECVLYPVIIIKSGVWSTCHCLGLAHEAMVGSVCLSIFFWKVYRRRESFLFSHSEFYRISQCFISVPHITRSEENKQVQYISIISTKPLLTQWGYKNSSINPLIYSIFIKRLLLIINIPVTEKSYMVSIMLLKDHLPLAREATPHAYCIPQ